MKKILTNLYMKAKTMSGDLSLSANEIATFLGGSVKGDGGVRIKDISSITFSREGDITFASDGEELDAACKSPASCVLTTVAKDSYPKTVILVDDLKRALTMMYNAMLEIKPPEKGSVHPTAVVSESARLGKNVAVGPYSVIGDNSRIGDNCVIGSGCSIGREVTVGELSHIYPNVVIYDQTVMGRKVIVHSGSVIGSDGFGYVPKDGKIYKVPQMGNVIIEDNVEIGANTCIDRGTFTTTVVGDSTKIDNLVQVAHNTRIARNVLIAGQCGIAGSCEIGEGTMMGGNAGIADHSKVGSNVKIGAKTGVTGRVADGKTVFGYPHREAEDARKLYGLMSLFLRHMKKFKRFIRSLPEQ
ncbi:MAG: UDP-3-O-(3-hydroxymyristoyl)glucosamine N-acyltransferase [Candidatus Omnitrophica bacterium]|nr:UDP-3-O-(3-hydroxymyristoyl)glucosamine N-acyltransferase [Candidatus Omnitrophota bacterium]